MNRLIGLLLALLSFGSVLDTASAATRYDPRLRFRTIPTARFDIHFHQGEEALAQRLARIAEEVATTLERSLGRATGRVQVILVDQHDLANGWAATVPYNTIEITAASPTAESIIGNADDWLRLVFTHEYVHIVHLSRARGWIGGLRRVFGRLPILFPNVFEPIWQIEGIATWQESAQTGGGRVPAGDFRLFLQRAAAEKRLEPIDRASGRLVDWPSGNTPYLYGGYFHQYLADKYGADALRRLTDETARLPPYFGSIAFRRVFKRSLGRLWDDFEASVPASATTTAAERLTHHGFYVTGPRFDATGRLFYSRLDPHRFPALMEFDLSTRHSRAIATRYLGNRIGIRGNELIVDQIETIRDVAQQSDLYSVDVTSGRRLRRLTFGARAADPDVSPDGSTLVCTIQRPDRRELAQAKLSAGRVVPVSLVSQPAVDFASPRWSPDGRSIAVERRALGGPSEIAVVDAATGAVRVVVAAGRNAAPVWSSDSSTIFFASATDDLPFRIFAVDPQTGAIRRLEDTGSSAQSPAISPDGRSIVYVGYTADGYDLFQLPLVSARWTPVKLPEPAREPTVAVGATPALESRTYSPSRTLAPRFWTPTFESDADELVIGAATGAFDALGRHSYGVEAGFALDRARPDWQVGYAYDRWRPLFFAAVSDDTDPWRDGLRRTTEADAGLLLRSRRIRWSQTVLAEFHTSLERFECANCAPAVDVDVRRRSIRTGLEFDASRIFGYSISPEEGGRASLTLEYTRSPSDSASSRSATLDGRHYLRAWPRHAAIAVRGAAAASWGEPDVRRLFSASGSDPQPGGIRFGSDAIGLIRGIGEDRVSGNRAVVINLDYRVPLLRIERGAGTLPLFLRTVHTAVFVDVGNAWSDRFRSSDLRSATGAELSFDTIVGYFVPVTFSAGAAWRRGPNPQDRGFTAFARIGKAF